MAAVTPTATMFGRYSNISPAANAADGGKPRFKVGYIKGGATVDDTDTITVDVYANFKISKVLGILGFIQTTANSVIVTEAPTTTTDRENLVITVGGSTDNKQRFYAIYGI